MNLATPISNNLKGGLEQLQVVGGEGNRLRVCRTNGLRIERRKKAAKLRSRQWGTRNAQKQGSGDEEKAHHALQGLTNKREEARKNQARAPS